MWITLYIFCGYNMDKELIIFRLLTPKYTSCSCPQIIHKVFRTLSTIFYAHSIAFIHLSTYTTNTTN